MLTDCTVSGSSSTLSTLPAGVAYLPPLPMYCCPLRLLSHCASFAAASAPCTFGSLKKSSAMASMVSSANRSLNRNFATNMFMSSPHLVKNLRVSAWKKPGRCACTLGTAWNL